MAEPTTTAAATTTLVAAAASTSVLTAFGIPLGLRIDLLFAGFLGALVAIVLLNSVPSTGDTWRELVRTTMRRMMVCFVSSFVAGYMTPLVMLVANVPDSLLSAMALFTGAFAQQTLLMLRDKYLPKPKAATGEAS